MSGVYSMAGGSGVGSGVEVAVVAVAVGGVGVGEALGLGVAVSTAVGVAVRVGSAARVAEVAVGADAPDSRAGGIVSPPQAIAAREATKANNGRQARARRIMGSP